MATTPQQMTEIPLTIRVSQQTRAKLTERAQQSGRELDAVASDLIEQAVAVGSSDMPYEQWAAEFNAWVKSHKPAGHFVDDSRESIYAGRGQ